MEREALDLHPQERGLLKSPGEPSADPPLGGGGEVVQKFGTCKMHGVLSSTGWQVPSLGGNPGNCAWCR